MSNMSKFTEGYEAGMEAALRIVNKGGTEALERELKFRRQTGIHSRLPMTEIQANEGIQQIKLLTILTTMTMSMLTLHDEFGFGHDRLIRFQKRYRLKTDCLADDDMLSWEDYKGILKDECGIEIVFEGNFK